MMKRRDFVMTTSRAGLALGAFGLAGCNWKSAKKEKEVANSSELFFKLSLAQWSLNRAIKGGVMDNLDFASVAAKVGCEGLEYVNGFFKDKAKDIAYLNEMNARAEDHGLKNVLIMIDGEGDLAHPDNATRMDAIERHYKWVEAAHTLGCHAIRVNLSGGRSMDAAAEASVDSLTRLSDFAIDAEVSILVENHGGYSSDGSWMKSIFEQVTNTNCGTLPDFGNFCVDYGEDGCELAYDRYKGMEELLPFAKAVSAKSYAFDEAGNETTMDYYRIMKMVYDSGYRGYVGIEFEGDGVSEMKGIELTRDLLIKIGKQMS
jgi:sugar phosphate isomerase/epimerase